MATAGAAALVAPAALEPEETALLVHRPGDSTALAAVDIPRAPWTERIDSSRSRLVATGHQQLLDVSEAGPISASLGSTESAADCQSPVSLSSLGSSTQVQPLHGAMHSGSRFTAGPSAGTGAGAGSASMHRQLSSGSESVLRSPVDVAQSLDSILRFPSVDMLPSHAGGGAATASKAKASGAGEGAGAGAVAGAGSGSARGPLAGGGGTGPIAERTSDLRG